jgi:protein TonB
MAAPLPEATPPEADEGTLLKGYLRTVTTAIRREYSYPRAARRAGLTGKAVVEMTIDGEGNVIDVMLASSSGHELLDRAALESARSIKRVPAAPTGLQWGTRSVRVPFSYSITS